tara:strand:- start:421 stop:624 length:204 start_codon:yes stop_codon:yes gene_type:complete
MSTASALTFLAMSMILLYLKKVEDVWKFQENQEWYFIWKTIWLGAWMCMLVAILLILFEQPDVRLGR